MQCPKCDSTVLVERKLKGGETRLDLCPGCKGVWFDENELPQVLGAAGRQVRVPGHAKPRDIPCPRCAEPLYTFCYPGTLVLIEMCKACRGIWLDDKEITRMRTAKSAARAAARRQAREEAAVHAAAPAPAPASGNIAAASVAAAAPATGAAFTGNPAPAATMRCPKCGHVGPRQPECAQCAVIVDKYQAVRERRRDRERRLAEEYPDGRGIKGALLRFVNGTIERLTTF